MNYNRLEKARQSETKSLFLKLYHWKHLISRTYTQMHFKKLNSKTTFMRLLTSRAIRTTCDSIKVLIKHLYLLKSMCFTLHFSSKKMNGRPLFSVLQPSPLYSSAKVIGWTCVKSIGFHTQAYLKDGRGEASHSRANKLTHNTSRGERQCRFTYTE